MKTEWNGKVIAESDTPWYDPEPEDAAAEIKDRVTFLRGVGVG